MRISDWSSDVCSSDLGGAVGGRARAMEMDVALCERDFDPVLLEQLPQPDEHVGLHATDAAFGIGYPHQDFMFDGAVAEGGEADIGLGAVERARSFDRGTDRKSVV